MHASPLGRLVNFISPDKAPAVKGGGQEIVSKHMGMN
jgi:hypothetical protein